jgi:hypothetical protein
MLAPTNPSEESICQLTEEEAKAYFDQVVRDCLKVSSKEFLKNTDKFKHSPHYETIMFLLPLVGDENVCAK